MLKTIALVIQYAYFELYMEYPARIIWKKNQTNYDKYISKQYQHFKNQKMNVSPNQCVKK